MGERQHALTRWREARGFSIKRCVEQSGVDFKQWHKAEQGKPLMFGVVVRIVRWAWKIDRARLRAKKPRRQRLRYTDFYANA